MPEDRKAKGALLGLSIEKNINMPVYPRISRGSVIDRKAEKETAAKYKQEISIKTPSLSAGEKFSGGNQQKVILAKWLAADVDLLIFDEPTRGIDVGAKQEIYTLINTLVEQGKAVLMISSEMEELMGMSDRIMILAEGRVAGELKKDEFNQETTCATRPGKERIDFTMKKAMDVLKSRAIYVFLLVMIIFFTVMNPNFLTVDNLLNVAKQVSIFGISLLWE